MLAGSSGSTEAANIDRMSSSEDGKNVVLSSQLVVWVLSIAGTATVLFWSWVAVTLVDVQADVRNLRDHRQEAAELVAERLSTLSVRVGRLEDQVERLRYGPGVQGNELKRP